MGATEVRKNVKEILSLRLKYNAIKRYENVDV
jgi:hypothetical protein